MSQALIAPRPRGQERLLLPAGAGGFCPESG
jgi:hypothetical protein